MELTGIGGLIKQNSVGAAVFAIGALGTVVFDGGLQGKPASSDDGYCASALHQTFEDGDLA